MRYSVKGGGTVFLVGKSEGVNQREVCGSRVYQACARPPRRRFLASYSVFVALELGPGELLRVSKRDGKCFFGTFRLPTSLETYMRRPTVIVGVLISARLFREGVRALLRSDEDIDTFVLAGDIFL